MALGAVLATLQQAGAPTSGASADSLRVVLDSVFAQRAYHWPTTQPTPPLLSRLWQALSDWLAELQRNNPTEFRVLFWALIGVLTLILLHAAYVAWRTVRGATTTSSGSLPAASAQLRDAAWYGAEASRLAAQGSFAEAMQMDFLRLMLQLDGRRVVRFHASKTPVEYTRDPGLSPAGRDALRDLVRTLYRYAFARVPCGPREFDAWRASAVADRYATAR